MAEIGIKELKATASSVIDEVESGSAYVITKRGRPAAVLLPIDEAEDLVLANADEYVRQRRLARADYDKGRTVKLEDSRLSAYEVRLSRSAVRQFKKLGDADRDRVRSALDRLAHDVSRPGRVSGKSVKTIRGTEDSFHRLRVGDHRVMYDVIDSDRVILVLGVVDRADLERWLRGR